MYAILDETVKEGDKLLIPFDEENISKVGTVVVVKRVLGGEQPHSFELAKRIKKLWWQLIWQIMNGGGNSNE